MVAHSPVCPVITKQRFSSFTGNILFFKCIYLSFLFCFVTMDEKRDILIVSESVVKKITERVLSSNCLSISYDA